MVNHHVLTSAAANGGDPTIALVFMALLVVVLMGWFGSIGLGQIFVWLVQAKPRWFGG